MVALVPTSGLLTLTFQIWKPSKTQLISLRTTYGIRSNVKHNSSIAAISCPSNWPGPQFSAFGRTWRQGSTRRHSFSCSSAAWPGNIEACRLTLGSHGRACHPLPCCRRLRDMLTVSQVFSTNGGDTLLCWNDLLSGLPVCLSNNRSTSTPNPKSTLDVGEANARSPSHFKNCPRSRWTITFSTLTPEDTSIVNALALGKSCICTTNALEP